MTHEREIFSPERVDEQIDQFSQDEAHSRFWHPWAGKSSQAETRLVKDLQGYYRTAQQEDLASLERAWRRVSPHLAGSQGQQHPVKGPLSANTLRISQERNHTMYYQAPERSDGKKALRWPGLLAAVLVAALLVGGLIAVLNINRGSTQTASFQQATPTTQPVATPTAQPIGTTIYTTPASQGSYTSFAWSPDSKRIASLGGDGEGSVRIWDATSGANAVTVTVSGQNEWPWGIAWSPTGQELVVGTNQHLLIVDGQTGNVLHSYASSVASTSPAGSPYLANLLPNSGGFGYRALAWSPDGTSLAASISFGASGSVQVWNVQKGAVSFTLSLGNSYVISSLAWSSDGKYLAAHGYYTQQSDPNVASDKVVVWSAATRQQVFLKTVMMDGSDAQIYWQPQTHHLAFMAIRNSRLGLEIWDALKGQQVHTFAGKGSDAMTFSPDGTKLAYNTTIGTGKDAVAAIVITDASSGVGIYTYKYGGGALTWSPDGKYIVSASGGQMVLGKNGLPVIKNGQPQTTPSYARVWIAS